jgi:Rieske 2Fe-2S family protein
MENRLEVSNGDRSTHAAESGRSERVRRLIDECRPGWSLPRDFYFDEEVYRADLDTVWRRGWLFAGHSCEIANPGDYVTLNVDTDSVMVIRSNDGLVRAFHNVCRHRGSLICRDDRGHAQRLVCPYHQWTYGNDGKLLACRGMQDDLDKADFGLHPVHAREAGGLIYISLAAEPPNFEAAQSLLASALKPQGIAQSKVTKIVDYQIAANWKLVWENNRECYHCNANHPQYIKANFDHYNSDDSTEHIRQRMESQVQRSESKWAAAGLSVSHKETGMTKFPDAERNIWFSANRTALVEGWVSESMDGKQVAPLMGDYANADIGTLRVRTLPNYWNHSSCDHVVSTRLLACATGCRRRPRLHAGATHALLAVDVRAGLGDLQEPTARREFERLQAGSVFTVEGVQRRRVCAVVFEVNL